MAIPQLLRNATPEWAKRIIDKRHHFYDISRGRAILPQRSRVLQFYSAAHNIGNYTPVLGIQEMLGFAPDTWNIHRVPVDFTYINQTYSAVIIGGAGLFHRVFEPFWRAYGESCELPTAIWGVGGCFIDGNADSAVSRVLVEKVASRCELINLRDDLTAEYYRLHSAHIAPCPTIAWLHDWSCAAETKQVLFASHTESVAVEVEGTIRDAVASIDEEFLYTDNIQRVRFGLHEIMERRYCRSSIVIATRLHGAIIAYGLRIPYVVVPWDEKLRAFQREWGNGDVAESMEELTEILAAWRSGTGQLHPVAIHEVRRFGEMIRVWLDHHGGLGPM